MYKYIHSLLLLTIMICTNHLRAQVTRIQLTNQEQPQQYTNIIDPEPPAGPPADKYPKNKESKKAGCQYCHPTKTNPDSLVTADPNYLANKIARESGNTTIQQQAADTPLFPDLQVNAIPEQPELQQLYGTEKIPGNTAFKSDGPESTERIAPATNPERPQSGKLEFLRQYAETLKLQINQNKRNPDYPTEAKKKELAELEILLLKQ